MNLMPFALFGSADTIKINQFLIMKGGHPAFKTFITTINLLWIQTFTRSFYPVINLILSSTAVQGLGTPINNSTDCGDHEYFLH